MISHLHGTITRQAPGEVNIDVHGVGYRVSLPLDAWERVEEDSPQKLWISTYIREDRFDLFGFLDVKSRKLFEGLLALQGIGPRTALELVSVPRSLLAMAVSRQDAAPLTSVRGIGKKTAEKLLLELKSLSEKYPDLFEGKGSESRHAFDTDAVAALEALGYDSPTIMHALNALPTSLSSTEERVAAALRSL